MVYVDNDPLVRLHSEPLLAGNGSTTVILGDLREPESILGNVELPGSSTSASRPGC